MEDIKESESSLLIKHNNEQSPISKFKQSYFMLLKSPSDLWFCLLVTTLLMISSFIVTVSEATYVTQILDLSDVEYTYYGFSNGLEALSMLLY